MKVPNFFCGVQDGTWAGQQEQVALARRYGVMIRVYQANQPAWTIKPDTVPEVLLPDMESKAPDRLLLLLLLYRSPS